MKRLTKADRKHMETAFYGPVSRRVLEVIDSLTSENSELRARLKVAGVLKEAVGAGRNGPSWDGLCVALDLSRPFKRGTR